MPCAPHLRWAQFAKRMHRVWSGRPLGNQTSLHHFIWEAWNDGFEFVGLSRTGRRDGLVFRCHFGHRRHLNTGSTGAHSYSTVCFQIARFRTQRTGRAGRTDRVGASIGRHAGACRTACGAFDPACAASSQVLWSVGGSGDSSTFSVPPIRKTGGMRHGVAFDRTSACPEGERDG